ncbi:MAG: nitroreductase family protein [Rikenellaceae bacterium]|nr:nitroreductase family protein [Rikenellaceae bacterium]
MKFSELVLKNRSYRRFAQNKAIEYREIEHLIDIARITTSGRNLQPLKYKIVNDPEGCGNIFPLLVWAGYLKDWDGPAEEERPSAYIIMCSDSNITLADTKYDQGISAQTILLGAVDKGFGGCIIATFDKTGLTKCLHLTGNLNPVLVIALGYPKENIVLTEADGSSIEYYRDNEGNHYVPKRTLKDILIK